MTDGRPKSRMYRDAARVAKRFEPAIADKFLGMVAAIQRRLDAIGIAGVMAGGAMPNLGAIDTELARVLRDTAVAAGETSADVLEGVLGSAVSFNASDPRVVQAARLRAGELLVAVSDDVRQTAAAVISFGADYGLTTTQMSSLIFETVGITPNNAEAPIRFADELRKGELSAATNRRLSAADKQRIRSRIKAGTVDEAFIQDMTKRYTASLRRYRANTIARTEALRASHEGQRVEWIQAREEGVLPPNARRIWIVTPDDRLSEEHAQIPALNPDGRGLEESFVTPEGSFMQPPTRPNCRCGLGLIFPGRTGVL